MRLKTQFKKFLRSLNTTRRRRLNRAYQKLIKQNPHYYMNRDNKNLKRWLHQANRLNEIEKRWFPFEYNINLSMNIRSVTALLEEYESLKGRIK